LKRFTGELSIFSDKMGKKVAENFVKILMTEPFQVDVAQLNFDDEGILLQRPIMVNNGILTSYLTTE